MSGKFELGRMMLTPGIAIRMCDHEFAAGILTALDSHSRGDWGIIPESDKALNDSALRSEKDGRMNDYIQSAYTVRGRKVNIKTEYDHSVTTVYLSGED